MNERLLDRLGDLVQVRREERVHAGYFFIFYLIVGTGLAIGHGTADALFFKRYGVEYLPAVFVAHAVVLFVTTLLYAAIADRIAAERLFQYMIVALIGALAASWLLMAFPLSALIYPAYYLLYEIASDLLVLHIGVYIAQNFETQQAKRLTPVIFAGAQLGTIIGGLLLALVAPRLGVANMIGIWIGLAVTGVFFLVHRHRHYGPSPHFRPGRKGAIGVTHLVGQIGQGLRFAQRSELMRWTSLALVFTVATFYITTFAVSRIYASAFETEQRLTAFFGWLTIATGGSALLLQLFVTGRLLKRVGVGGVNLIFPSSTMASMVMLLVSSTVPAALVASLNKDALMRAFRNPVRNLLFNAIPFNMQGRARAVATGLVLPSALVLTGGFLMMFSESTSSGMFLVVGLVAAIIHLGCNFMANRAYAKGILENLRERLYVGGSGIDEMITAAGPQGMEVIRRGVAQQDDDIAIASAQVMARRFPQQAVDAIFERMSGAPVATCDRLVRLMPLADSPDFRSRLRAMLALADGHLRGTILESLFAIRDPGVRDSVESLLVSTNPRLRSVGVYGVCQFGITQLEAPARESLRELLLSDSPSQVVPALNQLARCPDAQLESELMRLLVHPNRRIWCAALEALVAWPDRHFPGLGIILAQRCRDPDVAVRRLAIGAIRLLPAGDRGDFWNAALDDRDSGVRDLAAAACMASSEDEVESIAAWLRSAQGSPRSGAAMLSRLIAFHPPRELLIGVAMSLARQAREYVRMRTRLTISSRAESHPSNVGEILKMALLERAQDLFDLALTAAGAVDDAHSASLIRAGLRSRDRRHIASAREALHHFGVREVAMELDTVLEAIDAPAKLPVPGDDFNDDLDLLSATGDPWLRECVFHFRGAMQQEAA